MFLAKFLETLAENVRSRGVRLVSPAPTTASAPR
jgi:hypothetical protein